MGGKSGDLTTDLTTCFCWCSRPVSQEQLCLAWHRPTDEKNAVQLSDTFAYITGIQIIAGNVRDRRAQKIEVGLKQPSKFPFHLN